MCVWQVSYTAAADQLVTHFKALVFFIMLDKVYVKYICYNVWEVCLYDCVMIVCAELRVLCLYNILMKLHILYIVMILYKCGPSMRAIWSFMDLRHQY